MTAHNMHSPNDQAVWLAGIYQQIAALLKLLSDAEERLDDINFEFCNFIKTYCGEVPAGKSPSKVSKPWPSVSERLLIAKQKGREGVASLDLSFLPSGSALARLDGRQGVSLAPHLAALLKILAEDGHFSDDHLVGWKSVAEIKSSLKERIGKTCTQHAIRQLILRLRDQLEEHNESRFYVMNDRKRGYRFALRRGSDSVTDAGHNGDSQSGTGKPNVTRPS